MRRAAPRAVLVVLAVLLVLLAAGCAGVPTSGPVRKGGDLRLERPDVAVPFIATPPQPGATAEEVVRAWHAMSWHRARLSETRLRRRATATILLGDRFSRASGIEGVACAC